MPAKLSKSQLTEVTDSARAYLRLQPQVVREFLGGVIKRILESHAWHVNKVAEVEEELRKFKQQHFFESKPAPAYQPPPPRTFTEKGERWYEFFHEGGENLARALRLTNEGKSKEELKALANEWALKSNMPKLD